MNNKPFNMHRAGRGNLPNISSEDLTTQSGAGQLKAKYSSLAYKQTGNSSMRIIRGYPRTSATPAKTQVKPFFYRER